MKKLVVLSGGMDSTTLLYLARSEGHDVEAISFAYGQRHYKELEHAARICSRLGVKHDLVDLSAIGKFLAVGKSALLDPETEVPEGHYASDNMKATVVPNRNMIMLAVAAGIAVARDIPVVAYAAHPGDHAIYPDCRPEFADALGRAISLCDWSEVQLERPFVEREMDKEAIALLGDGLGVPWVDTWSCYKGGELHCGNCGTCVERREAFLLAGIEDPTEYAPDARDLDELLAEETA